MAIVYSYTDAFDQITEVTTTFGLIDIELTSNQGEKASVCYLAKEVEELANALLDAVKALRAKEQR